MKFRRRLSKSTEHDWLHHHSFLCCFTIPGLHGPKWLRCNWQEEERAKEESILSFMETSRKFAWHFCLHPIDQNLIVKATPFVKETWKCSLYFRWYLPPLKIRSVLQRKKYKMNIASQLVSFDISLHTNPFLSFSLVQIF